MKSIDALINELGQRSAFLLGIDGELGAGKTTLAKILSNSLDADCIHLDEFIKSSAGSYSQRINYSTLDSILKVKKCRLIIEGICLLSVLKKLDLNSIFAYSGQFDNLNPCSNYFYKVSASLKYTLPRSLYCIGLFGKFFTND